MKKIFIGLTLLIAAVALVIYMVYNKPHRNPADEKAIKVTAVELFKLYEEDEVEANKLYLDKTLEISGVVGEITSNQDQQVIVVLQTENSFFGVRCTMVESNIGVQPGQPIVIKGICTGYLSDVIINQAIEIK